MIRFLLALGAREPRLGCARMARRQRFVVSPGLVQPPAIGEQRGAVQARVIMAGIALERLRVAPDGTVMVVQRGEHEGEVGQCLDVVRRRRPLPFEDAACLRRCAQSVVGGRDGANEWASPPPRRSACASERRASSDRARTCCSRAQASQSWGSRLLLRAREDFERRPMLAASVELLRARAGLAVFATVQSCSRRRRRRVT